MLKGESLPRGVYRRGTIIKKKKVSNRKDGPYRKAYSLSSGENTEIKTDGLDRVSVAKKAITRLEITFRLRKRI